MHILPISFGMLTYFGYWQPIGLTSIKYWTYIIYSVVMNFVLYSFAFCGLVDCFIIEDLETFVDKFSLSVSVVSVSCKVLNLIVHRDKIIGLTDMLLNDICIPRNDYEMNIQRRFDHNTKIVTIWYEILNEISVLFAVIAQLWNSIDARILTLAKWVPYDLSSDFAFWATTLHQTIGLIACAHASTAHETLISGFMIQTCAQLDILCHRARTLPDKLREVRKYCTSKEEIKSKERQLVRELIHHHRYVYRLAERINSVFTIMIFIQFIVSSSVLCITIYKMLIKEVGAEFIWVASYLAVMLGQIFLYCWFSNELTLKSTEVGSAVYEMDWPMLPNDIMKSLLVIIMRAKKPIVMTSGYIVTLSNESFTKIIKISYSAFNVMHGS
ncbi:LOW QUALITY PROTEIN: odorant receptor 67a-like [Pogonomyrmex barbatus]|uniref:Odorant receptor n=1 Tax=Pogonomyrmex barbatus TaxID=144034 RepID=A0A6I9WRR8_9HYME|nr:LOW QUALITY PROTEIN: odorant receptor 67a-like [Pogonomyrmex barbatus]